jgi:WD40 repeat protein
MLLKRRFEEAQSMKNKLKSLLKYSGGRKMEKQLSDSDLPVDEYSSGLMRPHSSPHTERKHAKKPDNSYMNEKFLTNGSTELGNVNVEVKKKVFDNEIYNCVKQRQKTSIMEELIQKRDALAAEKLELQGEKQKLANYLAEHTDATEEDYKALTDVEDRLEILDAEIKYLTNGRLKTIQNDTADDENGNSQQENSYDNALGILKSLTNGEAEDMFQFLIEELVTLKVNQKTTKTQEGALNKTVMDLRHTLQLMRKAAVETALENESKMQELIKKHETEVKELQRNNGRFRAYKRTSNEDPIASLPPTGLLDPPDSRRGRKIQRSTSQSVPVEELEKKRRSQSITGPVVTALTNEPTLTAAASSSSIATSQITVNNPSYDQSGPFELVNTLTGHSGAVYALILDEQENRIYSASQDATVKLWDIRSSQNVQTYSGHSGFVRCMAMKDNTLFTGSQSIIRLWDCKSHKCTRQLMHHTEDIESLAIKNNLLFAASSDSTVSVWDLRNMKCVSTLVGHKGAVFTLNFYQDNYVLTGSRDHLIKVYNTNTFELVCTLHPPHYDVVQSLLVLNNSLYSGSRDYSIKKWDLSTLDAQRRESNPTSNTKVKLSQTVLSAHRDWIKTIASFSNAMISENPIILSGSRDGMVKLWDSATMEKLNEQRLHTTSLNHLSMYQSRYLVTASSDRSIRFWDSNQKRD